MKMTATLVKLGVFIVVTALAGVFVAAVAGNLRFGPSNTYEAVFASASGVESGAEVRIAGVPVGNVEDVALTGDGTALVTFDVATEHRLMSGTRAAIRYKNLIGDRFVELTDGPGSVSPLAGRPIPVDQTTPALDLDQVVNGFRPLLQGLDPDETNRLSVSLVQILNGQESGVSQLISDLGLLTNTLADHDESIGSVITNFNTVLETVDARSGQLGTMLGSLQSLVKGLSDDRSQITGSLDKIDSLTGELGDLLLDSRPDIKGSVEGLNRLSTNLNASTDTLNLVLSRLPETYRLISRASGYGSFVNFFVCGLAIRYGSEPKDQTPMFLSPAGRCQP
ncbi:phospholipid/cholesterol/gamma-HCH transport system substrate-binding protein [Williamsia limnetica]|uniref:Phospholipid/cholesterol/gamma-HCH transport system substrate-binding protein n=1 Tax=Williamsia limnetica TaxID=882452 RepID=A0A318RTE2_WILLI|nr:MCE family protein [Williamsia limnetica]PYE12364.1 phospholipid/cholesterol/gamma-HCH transport system substrate-binding protein [Williamsia limnetica]